MSRLRHGLVAALASLVLAGCQQATTATGPSPSVATAAARATSASPTPHGRGFQPGPRRSASPSGAATGAGSGLAPGSTDPASGLPVVALADLPAEAGQVLKLVQDGGPFRYAQDGVVYHNNNRVLPRRRDGYYHEYTVPTPGSRTRGARRIIHGSGPEYYWTADHYDTFRRIA